MSILWTIAIVAELFASVSGITCPQTCTCTYTVDEPYYVFYKFNMTEWMKSRPESWTVNCAGHIINETELETFLSERNFGDSLAGIRLRLNHARLTQIPPSVCRTSNLLELDINDNRLTRFDNNCFTNMTSLTHLSAERNQINELLDGVFDGLKSLKNLHLSRNRISDIGLHVFSYHLRNLRHISLNDNSLLSLQSGVFDSLESLVFLNLSENRISNIDLHVFSNRSSLQNLKYIELKNNSLTSLQDGVFDGLESLDHLYLSGNQISNISSNVFSSRSNLSHLRKLEINDNLLTSIDDGVFDGLLSLDSLQLSRNRISHIGPHVFSNQSNLQNLRYIRLNDNSITSLQGGVFDGLESLHSLNLRVNLLKSLQDGVFNGLKSLRYLYLSSNRISDIGLHVFSDPSSLRNLLTIKLNNNLLKSLHDVVFDGLKSLRSLHLSRNRISDIGLRVFSTLSNLRNLREINLNGNLLTSLHDGLFDGLNSLGYLYLSGNRISDIDLRVFSNRPNAQHHLGHIDLSDNLLASLEPWPLLRGMSEWPAWKAQINVSNNFIYKFTNEIGLQFNPNDSSYFKLQLDISNNNIQYLNDIATRWNLTHLSPLALIDGSIGIYISSSRKYNCDCQDIEFYKAIAVSNSSKDTSVAGLKCSTSSNLVNKSVSEVPLDEFVCELEDHCPPSCQCVYCPANDTLHVYCSSANLSSLPRELPPLPESNVRYKLDFSNNKPLSRLDHRTYFVNASIFDASYCTLDHIDFNIWQELLTNVQSVYLHGNMLSQFPWEITRVNVTSTSLTLSNNPWDCSCSNQWMTAWLKSLSSVLTNSADVVCATPPRLRNRIILNLVENDFCVELDPLIKKLIIAFSTTLFAVAFLLLLVFALYRLRVRVYKRWNFHPFDRDECVGEDMDYDVFLCCSSEDSPDGLRILELMEFNGFSVCYHERDFLPGELITDNMTHGVERSKRTVCLISENFTGR